MNDKLNPTKRRRLSKKEKVKEKMKENLCKSNDYWNDRKFQLHWNDLEWVYLKTQEYNKNPFFSSNNKFYIKDINESCNFIGHPELKLI